MKNLKIKFAVACFFACVAVFTGYNIYNNISVSDQNSFLFQNVEALANGESGSGQTLDCWQTIEAISGGSSTHKTYCGECAAKLCRSWSDASTCNTK